MSQQKFSLRVGADRIVGLLDRPRAYCSQHATMTVMVFDTAHPDGPRFGVYTSDTSLHWVTLPGQWHSTDKLMPAFLRLLKKHHLTLHDIDCIFVVPGPGSFTAVRAGVVWANALGFSCSIPVREISRVVAEQPLTEQVLKRILKTHARLIRPLYGAEPRISKQKPALR